MSPSDGYQQSPSAFAGGISTENTDIQSVVAGLCSGDFHDRWDQSRQVANLGDAALVELLAVLLDNDQDWDARWFAARNLGGLEHPAVIPALLETFATTTDSDLQQSVAMALSQVGPAAIAALGEQLAHPDRRPMAVEALARIHHPDTIPLLIEAAADGRAAVRAMAIDALGKFVDPSVRPVVEAGLSDGAAAVRLAAIRTLLNLRSQTPVEQLIAMLTPRLDDPDGQVAQQAAYALGRLSTPAAAQPLLQRVLAAGSEPERQASLVRALLWQNTAVALEGALQSWDDLGDAARLALVQGVTGLTPNLRPQAAAALTSWMHHRAHRLEPATLRRQLVLALGQIGTPALEPELRSLLSDPDLGVQLHAEAALRQLQLL